MYAVQVSVIEAIGLGPGEQQTFDGLYSCITGVSEKKSDAEDEARALVERAGSTPYCPEDGASMTNAQYHGSLSCYDCPSCGAHWRYCGDEGTYEAFMPEERCDTCGKEAHEVAQA